ncbi:MAG: hypothetical protein K6G26_06930 [Lachnospiraceae bacterium]|nr:hypothetical protein [Lachnospiraceae bacterium]
MNDRYENRYTVDKKRFMDMYMHPMKNNNRILVHNIIIGIMLFTLVLWAGLFMDKDINATTIITAILMLICLYLLFFARRNFGKKSYEYTCSQYNKTEWEVVTKFEEKIVITEDERVVEIAYHLVSEIIDGKEYIGILQGNEKGVRLLKTGFKDATPEEFMKFIKEKCTNIKK